MVVGYQNSSMAVLYGMVGVLYGNMWMAYHSFKLTLNATDRKKDGLIAQTSSQKSVYLSSILVSLIKLRDNML